MAESNKTFGFFKDEPEDTPPSVGGKEDQNSVSKVPADDTIQAVANQRYLVFNLGETKYATPLLSAREVVEVPKYRNIPNAKEYFLGIANLRGEVVTVVDMRKVFGQASADITKASRNVVIQLDGNHYVCQQEIYTCCFSSVRFERSC